MSRHLVYFAHGEIAVLPAYASALAPVGDVDLVLVRLEGKSSVYAQLGEDLRDADGRILPGLSARYPAPEPDEAYATRTLVTYSAGYALARAILAGAEDRDALDAYIAVDSIHADLVDGVADAAQIEGFVAFAAQAKAGDKTFWLGHSDVRTAGYASTTQVAARLLDLVDGEGGGFVVRAFNLRAQDANEHRAALTAWGPGFVAEALISGLTLR
ncbi:MAG: hypothetical protein ABJE95_18600 [Byssovorax sp.]